MKITEPGFKQFRSEGSYSYLVFDPEAREGILVDPRMDQLADYREFIHERGLRLRFALDTGFTADFTSGVDQVCSEFHCTNGQGQDVLPYGKRSLRRLALPGVSARACAYVGQGWVLSGETLLAGAVGFCDRKQGGTLETLADSLKKLAELPAETLVFPARDANEILFTTIGNELEQNATFRAARSGNRPSVLEALQTGALPAALNAQAVTALTVEKYAPKIPKSSSGVETLFIDVREPSEYQAGHFPGVESLPLSFLGFHLKDLRQAKRIYFSCLSGRRSLCAAKTLAYLGGQDLVNITGGYKAWCSAGLPVES